MTSADLIPSPSAPRRAENMNVILIYEHVIYNNN